MSEEDELVELLKESWEAFELFRGDVAGQFLLNTGPECERVLKDAFICGVVAAYKIMNRRAVELLIRVEQDSAFGREL